MDCEMCGRRGRLVRAEVEGSLLSVCQDCATFGTIKHVKTQLRDRKPMTMKVSIIDPNFAKIVKNNRILMNLTLKQLAEQIGEKINVIERVENGMRPTDVLAQRLEKALNAKLLGFQEVPVQERRQSGEGQTIGEIAIIRRKNKQPDAH